MQTLEVKHFQFMFYCFVNLISFRMKIQSVNKKVSIHLVVGKIKYQNKIRSLSFMWKTSSFSRTLPENVLTQAKHFHTFSGKVQKKHLIILRDLRYFHIFQFLLFYPQGSEASNPRGLHHMRTMR